MMPFTVEHLQDVKIVLNGDVYASENWEEWPSQIPTPTSCDLTHTKMDFWTFVDSTNISISGKGMMDGRGFMWWQREWLRLEDKKGQRPVLIKYLRCFHIELQGILVKNSPYYHIVPFDSQYGYIHDLEIFVDTEG